MVQKFGQIRIAQVLFIALIASLSLCGCTTSRQSSPGPSQTAPNGTTKDNSRISQAKSHYNAGAIANTKKPFVVTQRHTAICSNLVLSGTSEGAPSGGVLASSSTVQGGTFLDAFHRLTERLKENTPTARISLATIFILAATPFVLAFAKLRQTKIIVESQLYHQT